jgi:pimeloyl-ACP methyl ester carboxylesterase
LYGASDRFQWSGGYSDAARALAGSDLHSWVQQHHFNGLDLFTHSHGGSVAMLANHAGTKVGHMVLLSCPVHWPKYTPDFSLTISVVSVRVHMDLVILADRGGQRFSDSRIRENVLPIWFDHFATHDPGNWQKYNIPAML